MMCELESVADGVRLLLQTGAWQVPLVVTLAAINAVTVGLYVRDKRAARRRGARRIPERTLHAFELFGGWPGALFAQRWLRHKTVKPAYRRTFRSIVALHLLLAAGLLGWWVVSRGSGTG